MAFRLDRADDVEMLYNSMHCDGSALKIGLYIYGSKNLLVEGGDKISKNLIKNRLIDTFYLFQSPKILRVNKINQGFTSFGILNAKYKKVSKITSKLAKDNITIYKR